MPRRKRKRKALHTPPPDDYQLEGATAREPDPTQDQESQGVELLYQLVEGLRDALEPGQMFLAGRHDGSTLAGVLLTRGEGGMTFLGEHEELGLRPWDQALAELRVMLDDCANGIRVYNRPDAEREAHLALDRVLDEAAEGWEE